jgi:hypothetical protein
VCYNVYMEEKQPELKEYLQSLYPNDTEDQILYYIKLIEDNSQESLPPTPEMLEFLEVKKQLKVLEDKEAELRAKIIAQKQRLGLNFQLVKVGLTIRHDFNDEGFYDFVSTIVSKRVLKELTVKTIDKKKFQLLEANGKIKYDSLPSSIYKRSESYRITTPKK